eukprot:366775-Pelagomonas_calceolata.AAC.1
MDKGYYPEVGSCSQLPPLSTGVLKYMEDEHAQGCSSACCHAASDTAAARVGVKSDWVVWMARRRGPRLTPLR